LQAIEKYDMIAFTAPSGAGKTTIVKHLLNKYSDLLQFSISATTRDKRENEIDGKDYYFLSTEEFKANIVNNKFIEWEEVYANQYYGTLFSEVDRIHATGKKVIFDIDVHGAENIKTRYKDRCLTVFVKPPSFVELVQRLTNRKTETEKSFRKRINRIKKELLFENSFDMVLLNDILEETFQNAEQIVENKMIDSQ
jgi:guanylate kinase